MRRGADVAFADECAVGGPAVTKSPITKGVIERMPLLVDRDGLAAMLDVSPRQAARLDAAGKVPAPISFGRRSKRWAVEEIRSWIASGAPPRSRWAAMRRSAK
jgi:predicted DNA-binding transcriptional regulator AlpA